MIYRGGHRAESHVTDKFDTRYKPPRRKEQLAIPCIAMWCDCEDFHTETEPGVLYQADYAEDDHE